MTAWIERVVLVAVAIAVVLLAVAVYHAFEVP